MYPCFIYCNAYDIFRVYDIEKRVGTPSKYLFPSFETTNWYAAKHIYDIIKGIKIFCSTGPKHHVSYLSSFCLLPLCCNIIFFYTTGPNGNKLKECSFVSPKCDFSRVVAMIDYKKKSVDYGPKMLSIKLKKKHFDQ